MRLIVFINAAHLPCRSTLLILPTAVLVMVVLALVAVVTLGCALAFPDRKEDLQPELWQAAPWAVGQGSGGQGSGAQGSGSMAVAAE